MITKTNIIQKPSITIYRDGEYDRIATWKPAIRKTAELTGQLFAETIDRWFVEHKW